MHSFFSMTRALSGRRSERRPLSLDLHPTIFGPRTSPPQLRAIDLPSILMTCTSPESDDARVVRSAPDKGRREALCPACPRREHIQSKPAPAREAVDGPAGILPKPAEPFRPILLSSYLFFRPSEPSQSSGHGKDTRKRRVVASRCLNITAQHVSGQDIWITVCA